MKSPSTVHWKKEGIREVMTRHRRGRPMKIIVVLGVVIFVVPLISAYIFASEDYPDNHLFLYEILYPDPTFGFAMRPDLNVSLIWKGVREVYITDERGFSNLAYNPDAPIAVIGDSFTAAYHVPFESRWPQLLSEAVNISVYNYGVTNYAPWQYEAVLTNQALKGNHQLFVINIYFDDIGSDSTYRPESRANYYALAGWEAYASPYHYTLFRLIRAVTGLLAPASDEQEPQPEEAALNYTLTQLDSIIDAVQASGRYAVFTLIPSAQRVEQGTPAEEERLYYAALCAYIRSRDHLCYDMTQDFAVAYEQTGEVLYNASGHWNEAGNALAAELIYTFLQTNQLLEEIRR